MDLRVGRVGGRASRHEAVKAAAREVRDGAPPMAPFRRTLKQAPPGAGPRTVELAGTASDLMLFLWQRIPADRLAGVTGERDALDRYFTLVPPV